MTKTGRTLAIILLVLALYMKTSNSFKILIPGSLMRGRGHTTILSALCAELTSRGHEVTILVPSDDHLKVGDKFSNSNATEILEYETVPIPESDFIKSFRAGNKSNTGIYDTMIVYREVIAEQVSYCRQLLINDQIMSKLKTSNFDLMIEDMANGCDALLPVVLQLPFIALTAGTELPLTNYYKYGFPLELSYFMSPLLVERGVEPMSFFTRVKNVIFRIIIFPFSINRFAAPFKTLQDEFNISPDIDGVTLGHKAQFWLAHDSFMLKAPHPGMPNWCHVGGMAAARPKPLPSDLAEFADGSGDEGFIVFSPGSIVTSFDPKFNTIVASVLNQLPQRVFWKNDGLTTEIGNNIKVSPWLPQNDLLAHPKARLFIGHGGLNGMYEALYHGVPMLLIPQMLGSQTVNAKRVVNRGYGLLLLKKDFTAEALESQIKHILNNSKFSDNIRRCSQILQDDDPMDRAVYWVEHVLKFGGGYLRAEVFNLNFIQYYLLDVLALFLVIMFLSGLAMYACCLRCCSFAGRRYFTPTSVTDKHCKVE